MDHIIWVQSTVNVILMPISLLFLVGMWWMENLSYYITKEGCYIGTLLGFFHVNYMQCHSFAIWLFRYICILHPNKVSQLGSNAPQVRYGSLHICVKKLSESHSFREIVFIT